jgi:inosose dehydratase
MGIDVKVGTAPDSWGVWFPSDPRQIPWNRFLDEVVEAGYRWTELGPPGYLPSDTAVLAPELKQRSLEITAGFVMRHFEDPGVWPTIEAEVHSVGRVVQQMGGLFLVVIGDTYTDLFTGEPTRPNTLDADDWKRFIDAVHRVARIAHEHYGLRSVYHPHAETHVEYEHQIEKFLEDTDPNLLGLCLDTGHHAYRKGDAVAFMARHHARIPYLHLKSVDAQLRERVEKERIPFAQAVSIGLFCEPSRGAVDFPAFRDVLDKVGYHGWAIVEQDMYPAPFDQPLPVAKRTRKYLQQIGVG